MPPLFAVMLLRRISIALALVAGLGLAAPLTGGVPDAAADDGGKASKASRQKSKRSKRRRRAKRGFRGHNASSRELRNEALARPSGDIELRPNHFKGEVYKVNIYDDEGNFDETALARLDHAFRCRRTGNERAVDPRLYEMLSRIYDHFGRKPIILISGHRYQRNEKSRHFHAAAMDIEIKGVSTNRLYRYASSLDPGGMGVGRYPRSGFVHIDFRAPGAKSYRWTDWSGGKKKKKKRKRPKRRRKPVS